MTGAPQAAEVDHDRSAATKERPAGPAPRHRLKNSGVHAKRFRAGAPHSCIAEAMVVGSQAVTGVDPGQAAEGILGDAAVLPPEPGNGPDATALRAVAVALRQQGRREQPCGSNSNPYSTYFGFGPQFWCADFVAWCIDSTGDHDRRVAWGPPSAVRNITGWAERNGLVVAVPERGDIFTYRSGAHCGLVTGCSVGRFTTVEGNTTGRDGRTCWVAQHTRRVDDTYYFVRWA